MRGLTLEELRAFLTSILVKPTRSRNWPSWLRLRTQDQAKPGPVAVPKTDSSAATTPNSTVQ
jgi:hypothetical protein